MLSWKKKFGSTMTEIRQAREGQGAHRELELDGPVLGARHLTGLDALEELQRLGDALLQLVRVARLGVLVLGDLDARETPGGALGGITGDLHLPAQPVPGNRRASTSTVGSNFLAAACAAALSRMAVKLVRPRTQHGNGQIVHRDGHDSAPWTANDEGRTL